MSSLSPNGKAPETKDKDAAEGAVETTEEKLSPDEEAVSSHPSEQLPGSRNQPDRAPLS
jgi:hypothetical protein